MTDKTLKQKPESQNPDRMTGRNRLIEAAIELFGSKGFENASLDEIAELAGVSKGLVHKHFGGKIGLRQAVDASVSERRMALFSEIHGDVREDRIPAHYPSSKKDVREELEATAKYMRGRLRGPPDETTKNHLIMTFNYYRDEIERLKRNSELRSDIQDEQSLAMCLAYFGIGYLLMNPIGVEILQDGSNKAEDALDSQSQRMVDTLLRGDDQES